LSARILIVGAGSIGLKQVRAFSSADPQTSIAVIDADERRLALAREHGAQTPGTAWDETDLSRYDGVVICVPSHLHVPFLMRCLREGVPVLCEKPLAASWDGVPELLEEAHRRPGAVAGIAYVRRYHPAHEYAHDLVRSGQIGPVLSVRVAAGQPFAAYRPDYRDIYYASREKGGGCTLDFASHFLDLIQWYAGPVRSMRGFARHLALAGVDVDDTVAACFDFEECPAIGVLHVNQYQPVNENLYDFAGPEAALRVREPGFECEMWRKGASSWEHVHLFGADYAEALRRQAAAFLAALAGGPPMRTGIAEAARTLRLCLDLLEAQGDGPGLMR